MVCHAWVTPWQTIQVQSETQPREHPKKQDKSGLTTPPEFKAETRQLLDIGTNSLYTHNKVFLREFLSNTSDALKDLRYIQAANHQGADGSSTAVDLDIPFDIHVETNDVNGTLNI